jgi:hypothetical protein
MQNVSKKTTSDGVIIAVHERGGRNRVVNKRRA